MRFVRTAVMATSVLLSSSGAAAGGEDWPQWRGQGGDGTTETTAAVTEWGVDRNVKWRVELPEAGNSTPAVWGDRVYLTQPLSETGGRAVLCLDRESGRELWRRSVTVDEPEQTHRTNPYCSASPATDGERVIAWFGSAGVVCYDPDGELLWKRDDLGPQEHKWGYGSSPVIHGDLCILLFGPGTNESLMALDVSTGQTRWRNDLLGNAEEFALSGAENDGGANDFDSDRPRSERLRGAWSTPIVINVEGGSELVATLPRRVSGFDLQTGERLWTCGGAAPLAYASPIESDGVIVALGGYGGASLAVRAGGRGDVTNTHRLWQKPKDSGWLGTGIAQDGVVYACTMGGVLKCFEAATGDEHWSDRAPGGGTWSSITQDGEQHLFLLTKSGTTTVFRPDGEVFNEVASNELGESTNASVVVAGGDIFVRTDAALWCFSNTPGD